MSLSLPLLEALISHFRKFPGVGEKTARRMAFSVLELDFATGVEILQKEISAPSAVTREGRKRSYASLSGRVTYSFLKRRDVSGAATTFCMGLFHPLIISGRKT